MNIDVPNTDVQCFRCGKKSKRRGNYYSSRLNLYKGVGYLSICNECVDEIFNTYMKSCNDIRLATRMLCLKLNLYWSDKVFDNVVKQCSPLMVAREYIMKLNITSMGNKCYEDTLNEEGNLWSSISGKSSIGNEIGSVSGEDGSEKALITNRNGDIEQIDKSVQEFWGRGYSPSMYNELEERKNYYLKNYAFEIGADLGKDILFKTACILEVAIAHDGAAGRPVNTNINSLNQILDSLNLKPNQKKANQSEDIAALPFGVKILKWEDCRPVPSSEKQSSIVKFVLTWVVGYLVKTFGSKNAHAQKYAKMYDDAIERYSIKRPEFDEDENEIVDMLSEVDDE